MKILCHRFYVADEIPEIDVTTTHVLSPSPYEVSSPTIPGHDGPPSIHAFPMNVATNLTIRLPGTPLDKDIACSAGAEGESRSEGSLNDFQKRKLLSCNNLLMFHIFC